MPSCLIEVDATNVSPAFRLEGGDSSNSTIKGLAITHLASIGILVADGSSNNTITGNFIGVNVAGTASSYVGTSIRHRRGDGQQRKHDWRRDAGRAEFVSGNGEISLRPGLATTPWSRATTSTSTRTARHRCTSALRGIDLTGASSGNLIGGPTTGAGNVIGTWAATE